jgi:hypothetical protein
MTLTPLFVTRPTLRLVESGWTTNGTRIEVRSDPDHVGRILAAKAQVALNYRRFG